MSELPENFLFSQTSLQNWLTCQRRFELLYLRRLAYPAPETSDQLAYEVQMERGEAFHHLAHQDLVGIEREVLARRIDDEVIAGWWARYAASGLDELPERRYAEIELTAPLGGHRLVGKYDLLAVEAGEKMVIVDWKTSQKRPNRATLEARMQTLLYPYLLVEGGAYYNGGEPIAPEQVEMVYWFTNYPAQPERFGYDAAQHERTHERLVEIVGAIAAERAFPKVPETEKENICRFCNYRSLCWENVAAGALVEMFAGAAEDDNEADLFDFEIDLDQIAEIEF